MIFRAFKVVVGAAFYIERKIKLFHALEGLVSRGQFNSRRQENKKPHAKGRKNTQDIYYCYDHYPTQFSRIVMDLMAVFVMALDDFYSQQIIAKLNLHNPLFEELNLQLLKC